MTDPWITRMSAKAKAREAERQRQADEAHRERERLWVEFVEARGGYWPAIWSDNTYVHGHAAHGSGSYDAATGEILGVGCVAIDPDGWSEPPLGECPICRDFPTYRQE